MSFYHKYFLIFLFIFSYIKSEQNVRIWKNKKRIDKIDISNITSYAFEEETGAELFLFNKGDKNQLYLKENSKGTIIKNTLNLSDIEPELIKFDSKYFFCSSSSQELLWIENNSLNSKKIVENENDLDKSKKIKCFRCSEEGKGEKEQKEITKSIMITYIGIEYLFVFFPSNNQIKKYDIPFNDEGKILAINYFNYEYKPSLEQHYILITENNNTKHVRLIKKTGKNFGDIKKKQIEPIDLYQNIEIAGNNSDSTIAYLFSYTPNTNNYTFDAIDIGDDHRIQIDGRYYFRFFKDFTIKYAKFINLKPFLIYSVMSQTRDKTSYIGVADLKYFIQIYNVIENTNEKLYFMNGFSYSEDRRLYYFSDDQRISFCPFIEKKDGKCMYGEKYFDISKNNEFYENTQKDNCDKYFEYNYCLENCSLGLRADQNKICTFCDLFNSKFYYYGSNQCLATCKEEYHPNNQICYDCENALDGRTKYYENECYKNCTEVYGVAEGNDCKTCKEKHSNFSIANQECTDTCYGIIDEYLGTCYECSLFNPQKISYPLNHSCLEKCEPLFLIDYEKKACLLCNETSTEFIYYENGECVKECNKKEGYGFYYKYYNYDYQINITYCELCVQQNLFLKDDYCTSDCGEGYYIEDGEKGICTPCKKDEKYVEKIDKCLKECPPNSRIIEKNICTFCKENEFYYQEENGDRKCLEKCERYQIVSTKNYSIDGYNYNYSECIDSCKEYEIVVDNKCIECSGSNYLSSNKLCYKCFCGNNTFDCHNSSSQCNCENSPHHYGYSCEFYSEKNMNDKNMKIISLNNRLIKTGKNFFTYELKNGKSLSNNYNFSWKLLLNDKEITGDEKYKECFITSTNETFFGINEKLFENKENKDFKLSLSIEGNNEHYEDEISLLIIDSFEYNNSVTLGENSDISLSEMKSNFYLKNKINTQNKENASYYLGKYYYQYGILDKNNERFPLTDYMDSEIANINVICSKGYYINIKNDRGEIHDSSNIIDGNQCKFLSNNDISEIIDNKDFSEIEQIFLLISYFREASKKKLEEESLSNVITFIKKSVSKIINENGFYVEQDKESNNEIDNKKITYAEPKLIFSLIYYLSNYMKEDLNKESINHIFDLFKSIFTEMKNKNSNKTLSDSDIKSLFRTVDNLYDISIDNNINTLYVYENLITILDNITKYISNNTYPSETVVLMGKRISLLTHHLGKNENNISFPYIYNNSNTDINNILTYYYSDYYLNEQKTCNQKNPNIFCLNKENYNNINLKLKNDKEIDNNIILNVYLLPEINSSNEKNENGNTETINKIPINKNYSTIFKLYQNYNNTITQLEDEDIYLNADFDFPFAMNLDKEPPKEIKEKYNSIYINKKPINGYPNNSDIFCVPKSYYKNIDKIKNDEDLKKYSCLTHFNYDEKTIKCSCNIRLRDQVIILQDKSLAQKFKNIQFHKEPSALFSIYNQYIIYAFILLLLIPGILILINEIFKESKYIQNQKEIDTSENERKEIYEHVKKYCNIGLFRFSLFLTLTKYPYFSAFNKYYKNIPNFIRHSIVITGLFIGIIVPLIPYLFLRFTEREIFISQRDINFKDSDIKNVPCDSYYKYSLIFSPLGIIFGNLFIYFFAKKLNFEKEEINIWIKNKIFCKDYIYYEIKNEVLLGSIWSKIKTRMHAYYYLCGKFILKKNKSKSNKFNEYLKDISRNNANNTSNANSFYGLDHMFPNAADDSIFPKDINNESNEKGELIEMEDKSKNEQLIDSDEKENDNLLKKNIYENTKRYNGVMNTKLNLTVCKLDNFILDNKVKIDKSKRLITRFEKVRNKYIYVRKGKNVEQADELIDENTFEIIHQSNYSYISVQSFKSTKKSNKEANKDANTLFHDCIIYSLVLLIMIIIVIATTLFLVRYILDEFDVFILRAWIFPIIIVMTIINFILYFIKMFIASFVLFHFYHYRKKRCCIKFLFWLFVDRTMIQRYKIKNLVTKYKKEFEYL